jgi:catechol 2,3-dioxygenase-like lactoylglutathione lyase family enzyme
MITRFDHAVIAVRDLDDAIRRYRSAGFDVRSGGRHTGRGTRNALIRFGLDYLELIAVDDVAEARAAGQGGLVDFLATGPGGLAGFALATDDVQSDAEHFREAGIPVVGPFAMERLRPDGNVLSWRLLVPHGEIWRRPWPFLIEWDQSDELRLELERVDGHPNGSQSVSSLSLVARDLPATLDLWRDALRLQIEDISPTHARVHLGPQTINLLAGQDEGLSEVQLAATQPSVLTGLEARLVLVSATA